MHMTRTAESLHVAQPALSQAIARLEKELGVPLFKREHRSLSLTVYGTYLLERLRTPLSLIENLPGEMAEFAGGEKRTVRLNVTAASSLVTDAIVAYQKQHPGVKFRLLRSDTKGDWDIMVETMPVAEAPASSEHVFRIDERILVAVSRDGKYTGERSLSLLDLSGETFISLSSTHKMRVMCDRFCMQAGFVPYIGFEGDNVHSLKNLIAAHAGIGFWPEFTWGRFGNADVELLPLRGVDCRRSVVVRRTPSHVSEEIDRFYTFLCRFMSDAKRDTKGIK